MTKSVLLAFCSILMVIAIILQPDIAFKASLQGLNLWWNIVFPGLLPFLVLYEIMLAFGLVHGLGALTRPVMGRLFKLPGEGAAAIAVGWLGGYPAGAEAVSSLRKRELVSREQGQSLLALSHMPSPMFMLVIIPAGFLHKPIVGLIIASAVWLSAAWLMLLNRLFLAKTKKKPPQTEHIPASASETPGEPDHASRRSKNRLELLTGAGKAMQAGREADGRSFGKVLGDSVSESVQKLMLIGGFMIFASLLAKLAEPLFAHLLHRSSYELISASLVESHLGAYAASVMNAPGVNLVLICSSIAAVLAWSGFSGALQVGYAISGTDLRLLPFIVFRLNHAMHAFAATILLWKPMNAFMVWLSDQAAPSFAGAPLQSARLADSLLGAAGGGLLPTLWLFSISAAAILAAPAALLALGAALRSGRR
ncbi:nucleoside recognition domain-containing protein [Paenibacillus sp. HB172176]|uniref:nucleoside recognition domain-containing protein n=1 Tax=Paenibacillus sp. HB172176 TaxID=2493690 RepID=UPI00143AF6FA|nr:nucleoside recognition domain-containing protein [Paenibacillus sp. HB172176]